MNEDRKDDKGVTQAVLKTIAAFLNTDGGDLLIGVSDDGSVVGIERDQFDNNDKFMLHLSQVVRNGLGDRAGTCIDPKVQTVLAGIMHHVASFCTLVSGRASAIRPTGSV